MAKIGVLGAGTWGIALARMLANTGHTVTVWSAHSIDKLAESRKHPKLGGMKIPESIVLTKALESACSKQDLLMVAVPSVYVRQVVGQAAPFIPNGQLIVEVSKGIEPDSLLTMTELIADELSKAEVPKKARLVALSGPTHAEEVAKDMPTAIVSASSDLQAAEQVQNIFMNTCMRVYTNADVRGVELSGAFKNIVALASGISTGLGHGDNAKAAIITRGLAELTRLGVAMGCDAATFSGLAGVGDLIVTATSEHSRNNRAGYLIGKGRTAAEAVEQVGMVVEGINALPAVMELSKRYAVELPIAEAVNAIVKEGAEPAEVVHQLMTRDKKDEAWV